MIILFPLAVSVVRYIQLVLQTLFTVSDNAGVGFDLG